MTSTGLIAKRKALIVPGLPIQNFKDNWLLTLLLPEDGTTRTTEWIRAFVGHTTKGIWPQPLKEGYGPLVSDAEKVNRFWTNNREAGGAQFVMDRDGDGASLCDCATVSAYHAGKVNNVTQGLEIFQEQVYVGELKTGPLYKGQLEATVKLVDAVTWFFKIQRQIQKTYVGSIKRLRDGGTNAVGIYGHRDCCAIKNGHATRGRGDPGDHFYTYLLNAGYEGVEYDKNTDLTLWMPRQTALNKEGAGLKVDGVAGPATTSAVQEYKTDKPRGLWITRPIDELLAAEYGNDFDIWKQAA